MQQVKKARKHLHGLRLSFTIPEGKGCHLSGNLKNLQIMQVVSGALRMGSGRENRPVIIGGF